MKNRSSPTASKAATPSPQERLDKAINDLDLQAAEAALKDGADPNYQPKSGDTPLIDAVGAIGFCHCASDDPPRRRGGPPTDQRQHERALSLVRCLLKHGADPNLDDGYGCGPLFEALLTHDSKVLRLLLEHGGDPNILLEGDETLYEYAEFDYRYTAFFLRSMSLEPTEADRVSEEAWLAYLYRAAEQDGVFAPDVLTVLRDYGAKTTEELASS